MVTCQMPEALSWWGFGRLRAQCFIIVASGAVLGGRIGRSGCCWGVAGALSFGLFWGKSHSSLTPVPSFLTSVLPFLTPRGLFLIVLIKLADIRIAVK